jgi:hypothetical protein
VVNVAPVARLLFASGYRIGTVIRRGLRGRAQCNEACVVRFRLVVARRVARRLGIVSQGPRPVVIGRGTLRLQSAGTGNVTVRLTRRAKSRLRRARRVTVYLRGTATDVANLASNVPQKRIGLRR